MWTPEVFSSFPPKFSLLLPSMYLKPPTSLSVSYTLKKLPVDANIFLCSSVLWWSAGFLALEYLGVDHCVAYLTPRVLRCFPDTTFWLPSNLLCSLLTWMLLSTSAVLKFKLSDIIGKSSYSRKARASVLILPLMMYDDDSSSIFKFSLSEPLRVAGSPSEM